MKVMAAHLRADMKLTVAILSPAFIFLWASITPAPINVQLRLQLDGTLAVTFSSMASQTDIEALV